MINGSIYAIQNKLNIKIYIGKTTRDVEVRWNEHLKDSTLLDATEEKSLIHSAIKKYGSSNFNFFIIENNLNTLEELNEAEQFWIEFFRSNVRKYGKNCGGYNLTDGGGGCNLFCENNPNTNLTNNDVLNIIDLHKNQYSRKQLSQMYNVSEDLIRNILNGTTWSKITQIEKICGPAKGDRHPLTILSSSEVLQISKMFGQDKTDNQIAKLFGVNKNIISNIRRGETWAHLTNIKSYSIVAFKGKNINGAKLKKEQVLQIVQLYKNGLSSNKIAKQFSIGRSTVLRILKGETWSDITQIKPNSIKLSKIKLTPGKVLKIVALYNGQENNYTHKDLSKLFNISKTVIADILRGAKWSKITGIQKPTKLK